MPGEPRLGPLTTTLLLAITTPNITLPVERIERHFGRAAGYFGTGTSAEMPLNMPGQAFQDEDIALASSLRADQNAIE